MEKHDSTLEPESNSTELLAEQVDSVFKQLPLILGLDLISGTSIFVYALFVRETQPPLTFVWYATLFAIVVLGFVTTNIYKHHQDPSDKLESKEKLLYQVAILSGLIWGACWVIAPYSTDAILEPPRGMTIIWPCALLVNAAINFSVIRNLFFSFALPLIVLQVSFVLYMGGERDIQLAVGLSVLFAFLSFLGFRIGTDINRTIQLKIRNKSLDRKLTEEKTLLEQREIELLHRIQREEALLAEKSRVDNELKMAAKEKLLLLDAVGEGIFGINNLGKITFVNAMALKLLHFKEDEVIGQNALEIFSRSSATTGKEAETRNTIQACLLEGKSAQTINGALCGKADDFVLPVNFSCRPISEHGESIGAVVSFFDMSKQIEMESILFQSQKMEAIGRITGGVSHDFNNLLTVIMGNLQFLKRRLSTGAHAGETALIDNIMSAAKSGADLNKRLLSFSREQALATTPEDLNSIIIDMKEFLKRALGEEIEFELDLTDAENIILIDRPQFENVLVNLCVNAKDALPNGGKVSLSTRRVQLSKPPTDPNSPDQAQGYVQLQITDNGEGIPAEIQDKIFDPFFTTKAIGEGSGFGLSTSFGFLQQSGGNITVKSRLGEWTTFTLHIPIAEEAKLRSTIDQIDGSAANQYQGTILLVEDDIGVRDVATQMLLEAGFKVIAANDGHAGLESFSSNPTIDLVFSDIVMPGGMNGIEMAKKILKSKPDTPILLATGYTEKTLKDRIAEMDNVICISKPYDTESLPSLIDSC